ncbi:sugar hydrolase [Paenibacillus sp. ACRSA]|uniref:alpha-L-rhamnosidase-related protein n=1 Tax=Paenibacillus sp. ACRSA TaxID=2918211 RepID=UPI001EF70A36|nr:sugar hydrolase [Paenibacillus sp. ACRSA]MCG7378760.1 sugar hydrolase [Paenibacillus sp. ACRSA]
MSNTAKIQAHNVTIMRDEHLLAKAENLKPVLRKSEVLPNRLVEVRSDSESIHGWNVFEIGSAADLSNTKLGKSDSVIVDFGDHRVGYLSFAVSPVGSPPDAPLKLKLTFGEMPVEVAEPFSSYNGWISSSWLQEELMFIDVLPAKIELPRRYSFRYLKIEVLDTSPKYRVVFDSLSCHTVTSADRSSLQSLKHQEPEMEALDRVSIRTLEDCMQDVFEDGPKRDRRLWLGDLRLQALANYETFKSNNLVKRCLYLFAGLPDEHGRVSANLFIEPKLIADDTYLYDYSLLFTVTLCDYWEATGDQETLQDLWPTARRQIELALENVEDGLVQDRDSWWSFIDWHEDLNKQAPSQGVLIYTLKRAVRLANAIGGEEGKNCSDLWNKEIRFTENAAMENLWDENLEFFVSGEARQLSWASQIWMVLAEVLPEEQNRKLLLQLIEEKTLIGMTTPYLYHYLTEALLVAGLREEAITLIRSYWGGMIRDGADTFWELYDPHNKSYSPYGSNLINSYCHAWSCTPTYLIRKYGL